MSEILGRTRWESSNRVAQETDGVVVHVHTHVYELGLRVTDPPVSEGGVPGHTTQGSDLGRTESRRGGVGGGEGQQVELLTTLGGRRCLVSVGL